MNRSLASAPLRASAAVLGGVLAGLDGGAGLHAGLDDLGELALLLGGEQRHEPDLVEVLTYGICHGNSPQRLLAPAIFPADSDFHHRDRGKSGQPARYGRDSRPIR